MACVWSHICHMAILLLKKGMLFNDMLNSVLAVVCAEQTRELGVCGIENEEKEIKILA